MQPQEKKYNNLPLTVEEQQPVYGFTSKSEEEKLIEDIFRPDIEKLQLFTRMLRRNALLNKAVITHTK
jgi:hypothetical protein